MEWQPIETAPNDGSVCIVYDSGVNFPRPETNNIWLARIYSKSSWCSLDESTENGYASGHFGLKPTHWMPLPKPPIVK